MKRIFLIFLNCIAENFARYRPVLVNPWGTNRAKGGSVYILLSNFTLDFLKYSIFNFLFLISPCPVLVSRQKENAGRLQSDLGNFLPELVRKKI